MAKNARLKGWLALTGVALLMAALAVPTLAGTASASAVAAPAVTTTSPPMTWAYGGQGWDNGTWTSGNLTITWTASFGWTVVFTATNETNGVMIEEQRTVGVDITVTYTVPHGSLSLHYQALENDTAFANLTTDAAVYVNGSAVPALGIDNASAMVQGSIEESIIGTVGPLSASAYLNVTASASAAIQFVPALGLIPLNLSGIDTWNSTALATPSASWNIDYAWSDHGLNGTSGGGSGSRSGSWTATGVVSLTGYKVEITPLFRDHKARMGIVLILQGGADLYDGFILIPQGFDLFGPVAHPFDQVALCSAKFTSAEVLFLNPGRVGVGSITAAQSNFGGSPATAPMVAQPASGATPAAGAPAPGSAVTAQPMSVAQAHAIATCLETGCLSAAARGGFGFIVLVVLAVVVVVGTVGVIEWRSYAKRRSSKGLVGGYGESWPNGVPPAAAGNFPQAPMPPSGGPSGPDEPPRQL